MSHLGFGVSFADRIQHPPALEWKMSHSGPWRVCGGAQGLLWSQARIPGSTSSAQLCSPLSSTISDCPCPHSLSMPQSRLGQANNSHCSGSSGILPKLMNDTMEEKQQHRQGQESLPTLGRTSGKLVTRRQRGSHRAQ